MKFTSFSLLSFLSIGSFIQFVTAAPRPTVQRFSGRISFIKNDAAPILVSLIDNARKTWPCDNDRALIALEIKVGEEVTFTKQAGSPQTAFDVERVWHPAKITFVKNDGVGPKLVSLTDRDGKLWVCDNAASILSAHMGLEDHVVFKKRHPQTQTAFDVKKA